MFFSDHHPITCQSFVNFRQYLEIDVATWAWLFGLNPRSWGTICADAANPLFSPHPLHSIRISLMARWLDQQCLQSPSLSPIDFIGFVERLDQALDTPIQRNQLSLLLGFQESAAYRLMSGNERPSLCLSHVISLLDSDDGASLANNWRKWHTLALTEAQARGIPDLLRCKNWQGQPRYVSRHKPLEGAAMR